jgi:putative nucleotidyltransferase with HDIG domain
MLLTGLFTLILYPSLAIKRHVYQLGDVAERNIKATEDFFIEDKEATEVKRHEAIEAVLAVYDHDKLMVTTLANRVNQAFSKLRAVFEVKPPAESAPPQNEEISELPEPLATPPPPSPKDQAMAMKADFETMLGIKVSQAGYALLIQKQFSEDMPNIINRVIKEILDNGVVSNKEILLKEIDKGIVLRSVQNKTENTVTTLRGIYGLDQAKAMIRIVGDPLLKDYPYQLRNLLVDVIQEMIGPNITLNRSETEERRKQAMAAIKPILYQIKTGEMIIREGERVAPIHLVKFNAMQSNLKKEEMVASGVGAAMVVMCLLVIIYQLYMTSGHKSDKKHTKDLVFMACVLLSLFLLGKISLIVANTLTQSGAFALSEHCVYYGIPIASGAMVVCLFIGLDTSLIFSLLAAACMTLLFQNRFEFFIYFFLSSALAAHWIRECRERKVFIKAGMKLGIINIVLVTAIHIYRADLSVLNLLWGWGFAFMGGVNTGIISLGMAPLVEMTFGYKTDVTLLELANLDQPILRRLMLEAPGTYHHSVVVGSMVEAAAAEIGANPLKAKVCGYYHDIGKINKPLYFVENQRSGKNRHDKLAPSMSALILISHIKEGVEIARANRLGHDITDVIRQHHGNSLITFFYDKAKQQKGEDAVNIENFRYPGPRPQTREAGLVMLADVVEAASRTLENPTPARIQKLVQNLVNKIFSDGQLGNCELTLRDLHEIAKCFNKILTGIHHHRIEYPDNPATSNGKGKNGSTDRQPTKSDKPISGNDSQGSDGHLKRLGLS